MIRAKCQGMRVFLHQGLLGNALSYMPHPLLRHRLPEASLRNVALSIRTFSSVGQPCGIDLPIGRTC